MLKDLFISQFPLLQKHFSGHTLHDVELNIQTAENLKTFEKKRDSLFYSLASSEAFKTFKDDKVKQQALP